VNPDHVTVQQTSGADYRNIANYGRLTWGRTRVSLFDALGRKLDAKWQVPRFPVPLTLQSGLATTHSAAYDRQQHRRAQVVRRGPDGVFGNADDVRLDLGQFADTRLPSGLGSPRTNHHRGYWPVWLDAAKLNTYAAAHPSP